MNDQTQFVVPPSTRRSRKNIWAGFIFSIIGQAIAVGIFLAFTHATFSVAEYWYIPVIMIAMPLINNFLLIRKVEPTAIFNSTGIRVREFGLIPWENVEKVELYSFPFLKSLKFVGIRLKDVAAARAHAKWSGKFKLKTPKLFGDYHITLDHTTVSSTEILLFVRHYKDAYAQSKRA
jgi:hypothetical protein